MCPPLAAPSIRPHRQFITARVQEIKPAPAGTLEGFPDDLAAMFFDTPLHRLEISGVAHYQKPSRLRPLFLSQPPREATIPILLLLL